MKNSFIIQLLIKAEGEKKFIDIYLQSDVYFL